MGLGFVDRGDEAALEGQAIDTMQVQVRLQYGMRELLSGLPGTRGAPGPVNPYDTLEKLYGRGTPAQRLRFAVVAGDLVGPGKALEKLDEMDRLLAVRNRPLTPKQREVEEALRSLYAGGGVAVDPEAPARLSPGEAALLRSELGWYGELALLPVGAPGREAFLEPIRRLGVRFALLVLFLLLGGGLGFAGLVVFWYLVYRSPGTFFRLGPGRAPHGIYVETFAVWFSLFLALSAAGSLLLRSGLPRSAYLPLEGAVALLGLGALAWPVLRGIPWGTVRDDLGLRLSATPVRDVLAGIGCWFMGLPVMAAGFLCTVAISAVVESARGEPDPLAPLEQPNHPIVQEVSGGSGLLLVAFLAVCVAPVAEEIFFRGALYRHLRDATGSRGRAPSVAFSAVVSGLVFAAIHPQGLTFIPVLASVSWVLVHAREWRGSLLAPMTAHALHNALVTVLLVLLLGRA
jgi:membrane protease YdiL (CAAX protease family)